MDLEEKNVLYGGPDTEPVEPDAGSLGEIVLRKLAEHADKVIIIDASSGVQKTAGEIRSRAIQLAKCLRAVGIRKGDVIGLCSENRDDFSCVLFAALLLGATVAPLNISYTEHEMHHAVNLSKPKIMFTSALSRERVSHCVSNNQFIQKVITFDGNVVSGTTHSTEVISLQTFVENTQVPAGSEFVCTAVDKNTTNALILCSSGTTGLPKGVQLTQANLHVAISQMSESMKMMDAMGMANGMTTLSIIPWFHTYGLLSLLGLTLCGSRMVTMARFDDRAFLAAIETYKCDMLLGVPPLFVMLAKSPLVDEYDMSSLKVIMCGAAPLSKELSDDVQQRIGPTLFGVFQGFGMSEMTLSVVQQNPSFCTAGSVGVLRPGMWGKIVDPETGHTLGVGQHGEMCFKGSAVMRGYIGDAAATRNTIDSSGWLHTGDIGYYTEEGEWFIVDRLKELIKYKGFQVPPAELESILLQHPDVADAGVIGVSDARVGEKAKAFVVKRSGADLTEQTVLQFVSDRVSFAKRLHGGVQFVASIPKNQTGKILRRELRELQQNSIKSKL